MQYRFVSKTFLCNKKKNNFCNIDRKTIQIHLISFLNTSKMKYRRRFLQYQTQENEQFLIYSDILIFIHHPRQFHDNRYFKDFRI